MFRRKRKLQDFAAEVEAHVALEAERLREQGMSAVDAQSAAQRTFGNVVSAQERFYESQRWLWWDHLRQDLGYALRLMAKNPLLTSSIVLTLALGIGGNSVVFSVVRAVILRPLEYRDSDRIVQIWERGMGAGGEGDWASIPNFRDWERQNQVFQQMAAYRYTLVTITGEKPAESPLTLEVTDGLFSILGVPAQLGRTIVAGDETVAVISPALWQRRFDGDPHVVGRTLNINGRAFTVAGVMPAGFRYPGVVPGGTITIPVDLWIPMGPSPDMQQRGSHNYWAIARLKPGVNLAQARANLAAIATNLARQYPDTNRDLGIAVSTLQDHLVGDMRRPLLVLLGAIGLVLLLACANIASLLLSRAESRRREMAVRQALGAARGRLIRQALTESLLLACMGAMAGLLLARFGIELFRRLAPSTIPRIQETAIDPQVLLFTTLTCLAAGLLFGLAPALFFARTNSSGELKDSGTRSATAGPARFWARNLLTSGEVALALTVLIAAGLLIRSFARVATLDLGFRAERVMAAFLMLPPPRYNAADKRIIFVDDMLRRVRALPGVASAGVANSVPLTGVNETGGFRIEDRPSTARDEPMANIPRVSAGYFETMGMRLLRGRSLNEDDRRDKRFVAVASDIAASRFWPGKNPIGKRISVNSIKGQPVWREIVGIVQGTRHYGIEAPQQPEFFIPFPQASDPFVILVVRLEKDPVARIPALRREIAAVDPEVGTNFVGMDELLSNAKSKRRFQTVLLGSFAGLALVLAAIGVYGVMSFTVAQRTREIGVRLALGARPRDVVAMILSQGLRVTGVGIALGLVSALALSRVLGGLLFGVSALDPVTYAGVGLALGGITLLATWLPGRAAARVNPVVALREE